MSYFISKSGERYRKKHISFQHFHGFNNYHALITKQPFYFIIIVSYKCGLF